MGNADRELILVIAVMGVLFLLGLVAVGIFYRVWRKERLGKTEKE